MARQRSSMDFIGAYSLRQSALQKRSSHMESHVASGVYNQVAGLDVNCAPPRGGLRICGPEVLVKIASQQLPKIGGGTSPGDRKHAPVGRNELLDRGSTGSLHLVDRIESLGKNSDGGLEVSLVGLDR